MFEKKEKLDPTLYLVTNTPLCRGRPLDAVVEAALGAGVSLLQYRDKLKPDDEFVAEGTRLRQIADRYGVGLIVNDRAHLAGEIGAAGVHIGQEDGDPGQVRRQIGSQAILGLSVFSAEEARAAVEAGADYVAANGVFATDTKRDLPKPLGLVGLAAIADVVDVPLVAIGGIEASSTADVIAAGADGVAVVSAICSAEDIALAVKLLRCEIRLGLGRRASRSSRREE